MHIVISQIKPYNFFNSKSNNNSNSDSDSDNKINKSKSGWIIFNGNYDGFWVVTLTIPDGKEIYTMRGDGALSTTNRTEWNCPSYNLTSTKRDT